MEDEIKDLWPRSPFFFLEAFQRPLQQERRNVCDRGLCPSRRNGGPALTHGSTLTSQNHQSLPHPEDEVKEVIV